MKSKINSILKDAMKNKDTVTLSILRVLKGEIERAEQDPKLGKIEVENDKIYKMIKSLMESSTSEEQVILNNLLPSQLSDEKVKELVTKFCEDNGFVKAGIKHMKDVNQYMNTNFSGQFDKIKVVNYAKEILL